MQENNQMDSGVCNIAQAQTLNAIAKQKEQKINKKRSTGSLQLILVNSKVIGFIDSLNRFFAKLLNLHKKVHS